MSAQNQQPKAELIVTELRNLSSDLTVPSEAQSIDILTCEISSITFQAEKIPGAMGQLIILKGCLRTIGQPDIDFPIVGKIIEIAPNANEGKRVTVKLSQYDKILWLKFINSQTSKQSRIDALLSAIKGDE